MLLQLQGPVVYTDGQRVVVVTKDRLLIPVDAVTLGN
jgi:hypothetical protein